MNYNLVIPGKKVRVLFLNDNEEEIVYLSDNRTGGYSNNTISSESPLGKVINGAKEGEIFSFKVGEYMQRVKVIEVGGR